MFRTLALYRSQKWRASCTAKIGTGFAAFVRWPSGRLASLAGMRDLSAAFALNSLNMTCTSAL
jgi:hypothetical protein